MSVPSSHAAPGGPVMHVTLPAWTVAVDADRLHGATPIPDRLASSFIYTSGDMRSFGYVQVGEAHITVEVHARERMVREQVEALRKQQQQTQAEAQRRCTDLERHIQQLLALTDGVTVTSSREATC